MKHSKLITTALTLALACGSFAAAQQTMAPVKHVTAVHVKHVVKKKSVKKVSTVKASAMAPVKAAQ